METKEKNGPSDRYHHETCLLLKTNAQTQDESAREKQRKRAHFEDTRENETGPFQDESARKTERAFKTHVK